MPKFANDILDSPRRLLASSTVLGTSMTNLNGLTGITIPVGWWEFKAVLPIVNSGTPTNTSFDVTSAGGLVVTNVFFSVNRYTTAPSATANYYFAFGAATQSALSSVTHAIISGSCVCSTAGTITIRGQRTGGTSQTVGNASVGAYMLLERISV